MEREGLTILAIPARPTPIPTPLGVPPRLSRRERRILALHHDRCPECGGRLDFTLDCTRCEHDASKDATWKNSTH